MTAGNRARCIGKTRLFFSERPQLIQRAKDTCESCPIRQDCLRWALEHREAYGVWGGTDYNERRLLAVSLGYDPPSRDEPEHGTEADWAWHRRQKQTNPEHQTCDPCLEAYNREVRARMSKYRKKKRREVDFES